ncbi:PaaI family thioesterase [Candidatus Poriferisocius sp.]|uniref:PaaI family thioesterase n=1 Tax=Candidatus Poriferisocius sp. TaxID=3101276 RepID=UPI003B01C13C
MREPPLWDAPSAAPSPDYGAGVERLAVASAARRLLNAVRVTAASDDAVSEATELLEQAAGLLEAEQMKGLQRQGVMGELETVFESRDPMAFFPYSPIIGRLNPASPPAEFWAEGIEVHGRMNLSAIYAGPPGLVHGGIIAMVFDELLGVVNVVNGRGGYTGTLNVKYHRPTPLMEEIALRAWPSGSEGRKLYAAGEMVYDGTVTATAEGVFIRANRQLVDDLKKPSETASSKETP